jgi:MFS family permease
MTIEKENPRGVLKRHCAIGKTPLPMARLCKTGSAYHNSRCRSIPLQAPQTPSSPAPRPSSIAARPVLLILTLSLAPTVGLGIGRFAYALVLPDMRDSLHWSYSAAGFMNTINAAGYLAGALLASRLIRRFGWSAAVRGGTLASLASLALCAITGNFLVLSLARLIAGFGAAASFVAGGALAAEIAQSRPERASFLLSLFYAGPGLGILASGLIAPFVLQAFGAGSWWIVWWVLTALAPAMTVPLLFTPISSKAAIANVAQATFSIWPIAVYLAGYFLFGAGYIAYMTFMIAFVRDLGGGAIAQAAFWSLIGLSAFVTPWVWRGTRWIAGDWRRRLFFRSTPLGQRCRSSAIRPRCWLYRPSSSVSPSLRWSARPPPSSVSTTRRSPGLPRSRR